MTLDEVFNHLTSEMNWPENCDREFEHQIMYAMRRMFMVGAATVLNVTVQGGDLSDWCEEATEFLLKEDGDESGGDS